MPELPKEIEVKYLISSHTELENRLLKAGASLQATRVFELNLRFDRLDGSLMHNHQVLRLRMDSVAHLTFKGPADPTQPAAVRPEIEFAVSSFDSARTFLEALGYAVVITYEKYRTTYLLEGAMVTLDELPIGNFMEIEASDIATLQRISRLLALDWKARSSLSYLALFDLACTACNLSACNLTFAELKDATITPQDLNLHFADRPA